MRNVPLYNTSLRNNLGTLQPEGFPKVPDHWKIVIEKIPVGQKKLELFTYILHRDPWESPTTLLLLHGQSDHSGRYIHFPHYLDNALGALFAYDQRGHGRTEGLRGHIERFDDLTDDAIEILYHLSQRLKDRFGKSKIHVLGHSLGGLVLMKMLAKNDGLPIESVIFSAPLLSLKMPVPFLKRMSAEVIRQFWGAFQFSSGLDASKISRDQHAVMAYLTDRLVHGKVTPQFFHEMQKAMSDVFTQDKIKKALSRIPFLALIPGSDEIVDEVRVTTYFNSIHNKDKKIIHYPEFYHEPFSEIGKEKVFADLKEWIIQHD